MRARRFLAFNRAVALVLSWSMLWVGCAPVTSSDLRVALDQSKIKAAKKRGDTDLHIAAATGDSTAVLTLIGQGANLNALNDNGQTPLMLAIQQEQTNTAKVLIAHGAKANLVDEQGDTALHHAIRAGQVDVVRALLEKGAVPNGHNEAKQTPLILAAKFDYPEIALLLIAKGAQVAVTDDQGLVPVHYAANWRRTAVVKELLAKGVSPDVQAPKGQTALMTAAYLGDLSTVTVLLGKGAQIDVRDEQGQTSLHLAAHNGHRNVVSALRGRGGDLNAVTTGGRTPALLAALNDHTLVMEDLVQAGARFTPLAETERDTYASAMVAQAIAGSALDQKDIPRAREYQKLATEWFEKAAAAYEKAANSTDNKILVKRVLFVTGEILLITAVAFAGAMQQNLQNKQMAQMAALRDANASGTGAQGYFSLVRQYETAYRNIPPVPSPGVNAQSVGGTQAFGADEKSDRESDSMSPFERLLHQAVWGDKKQSDLERLRNLYRNVAEQGRYAAQYNSARLNCLGPSLAESDRATCLSSIPPPPTAASAQKMPEPRASSPGLSTTQTPAMRAILDDPAATVKGQALFEGKGTCFNCHGRTGKGDGPAASILKPKPTDLTNKHALKYLSDSARFNVMKFGIPGTSMVEMKHLSDEELWLIVAYLKQLAE